MPIKFVPEETPIVPAEKPTKLRSNRQIDFEVKRFLYDRRGTLFTTEEIADSIHLPVHIVDNSLGRFIYKEPSFARELEHAPPDADHPYRWAAWYYGYKPRTHPAWMFWRK